MNHASRGILVLFPTVLAAAAAADCVDYERFPALTGALDQPAAQFEYLDAGHLVAITEAGELVVLDVTDPAAPVAIGSILVDPQGYLRDLAICGATAYCNSPQGPVHAVDLTDPSSPVHLGVAATVGEPRGIDGQGSLLGVVNADFTWSLYDTADPLAPQLIHTQASETMPYDVELAGERALLRGNGWEVQDIGDPAAPAPIAAELFPYYNDTWSGEGTTVIGCALRGTTLVQYLNAWTRYGDYIHETHFVCHLSLRTLDLADPAAPVVAFSEAIGTTSVWPSFLEAAFTTADDLVLVGWSGVRLYAWDEPGLTLSHVATIPSDRVGNALAARGGTIHAADEEALVVFAYPDPLVTNLEPLGLAGADASLTTSDAVAGDGWFAALDWWVYEDGLDWVPGEEIWIYATASSLVTPVFHRGGDWYDYGDLAAAGATLYVVENEDLLQFDLTDPASPAGPTTIPLAWNVATVTPGPGGLIAAGGASGSGVRLYDVADPANPALIAALPSLNASDLLWRGDVLFAATATGVTLIDVAVPASPQPLGALAVGATTRLAAAGTDRVLAGDEDTLWLVDAADPHAPAVAAVRQGVGPLLGFVELSGTVYAGNGGVHALDGATLEDFGILATEPTVGPVLAVDDQLLGCRLHGTGAAIVPTHCGGVAVEDPAEDDDLPPAALVPLTAAPNPFNPRTEVRFTTARDGQAHLAAYDLRGRLVRTLVAGPLAAGPHAIAWDGRDDGGRALPSGSYLLRLDTAEQTSSAKVTLLE